LVPGSAGMEDLNDVLGVPSMPTDEIFLALDTGGAVFGGGADYANAGEGDQHKLFQNINNTTGKIVTDTWTEVTLHFDTSQVGGVWRAWIKKEGQARIQVARWIDPDHPDAVALGGATSNFQWNIPVGERVGHKCFQLNSVINGDAAGGGTGDHAFYYAGIDIATSWDDLPDYDS
jgi:hypothetical protein